MSHIHTYTHTYKSIHIPKSHISTQCLQVLQQVASLRLFSHTNELVPENIRDVRTATNQEGHVLDMLDVTDVIPDMVIVLWLLQFYMNFG